MATILFMLIRKFYLSFSSIKLKKLKYADELLHIHLRGTYTMLTKRNVQECS